jgi:3-hydroxybutyrate dehydrogenase
MKQNLIAVVTGGSSGIGLKIVEHLTSSGVRAISWDLQAPPNAALPYVKCDVSSEAAVHSAYQATVATFGHPNILINNCGLQHIAPIEEFPLEKWNQLISIMLTGTFLCSKVVIPQMKKSKWGRIINISSIHGKLASPYKSAYVAAKHGVLGLAKVVALEVAEFNITVNSICPGFVDTPLMRNQMQAQAELHQMSVDQVAKEIMLKPACIKDFTEPQQIADLVQFLISDSASTITGEAFNMSGGWGMGL